MQVGCLQQLDLSANLRKKMVPWASDAAADLGGLLVRLIASCPSLRSLSLGAADKDAGTVKADLIGLPDALADHTSLTSVDLAALRVDDATLCAAMATPVATSAPDMANEPRLCNFP